MPDHTHVNELNQIDLCMPNHIQEINFIPKFSLINFTPRLILTCCFESLWPHLTTPTWNNWINLLLLLIPYCMQKSNFITQLNLEIKLTHYSSSLWACSVIPDYALLNQPTNICCFHGPLITSKNSTSCHNLFLRYSSLKNPAFRLALRFLNHNSKTRFFQNMLFLQNVKRPLTLSCWSKTHIYLSG